MLVSVHRPVPLTHALAVSLAFVLMVIALGGL
jgi:hypothetical protein